MLASSGHQVKIVVVGWADVAPSEIGIAALIVTLGALLQSAVGFGMGLVVVPLLTWAGYPLPHAVALLLGAAVIQTGLGTYFARRHVR